MIYARYSSDNQREESIEGQIRECTAYAEKNGITIVKHYIDRAISAKTDNRPEFQQMIKDSDKKLFRRYMGTTPYNYLVNFRITQAKELLVLTDHSVSEIAQEVGFGDASNFSTRFAKATGQSPLQYRKSALKPQEGTR